MKTLFYLKTCGTCTKIMQQLNLETFELRELKSKNITEDELQVMYEITNSYEALFSKKSTQIKLLGLDVKSFVEADFKKYILQHYSFLKRPVLVDETQIFIGNSKENVAQLVENFGKTSS